MTPQYLHYLHEWQIKMAQGSKPGEGGQLPGHKVSAAIAAVRGSNPGVELISPPPHHDIYSIEDLAELMYELSQFNPTARGNVKLVSETGVAIVAAGVAKGGAQTVHISGHSGGTGASPLSSIKFAGLPWELGVQAAHQVLHANDLRERVKLVVDGGMQTGLQAMKAFLLGAEAVGAGHGAAGGRGLHHGPPVPPEHLSHRHRHAVKAPARQVRGQAGPPGQVSGALGRGDPRRCWPAMGYRSVGEIVGRTDLLRPREGVEASGGRASASTVSCWDGRCPWPAKRPTQPVVSPLNRRLLARRTGAAVETAGRDAALPHQQHRPRRGGHAGGPHRGGDRATRAGRADRRRAGGLRRPGAGLRRLGRAAHRPARSRQRLRGQGHEHGRPDRCAPARDFGCPPDSTSLVGNTVGYGATGGELYVAGRAGQRFMCRNSGATAVVEGVGPHGCEYMTKGTVVVLGPVGLNFAAGMTGGTVYLLDGFTSEERGLLNTDYVRVEPLTAEEASATGPLHALIAAHHRWTGSPLAAEVLRYWPFYARYRFDKVVSIVPRAILAEERDEAPAPLAERAAVEVG